MNIKEFEYEQKKTQKGGHFTESIYTRCLLPLLLLLLYRFCVLTYSDECERFVCNGNNTKTGTSTTISVNSIKSIDLLKKARKI